MTPKALITAIKDANTPHSAQRPVKVGPEKNAPTISHVATDSHGNLRLILKWTT